MTETNEQPITMKELDAYVQSVVVPKIEEVVDTRMEHYSDKILDKEDVLIDKLDQILVEQKAGTANYQILDKRVDQLENFAISASEQLHLEFKRT